MLLREIAHARAGDKGNIITVSLIAHDRENFPFLERQITAERVAAHFSALIGGPVERYTLPHLAALNFVLRRRDDETVTRSLALDAHGKCLSSVLLALQVEVEEG
jgi:hypothetical protein